MIDFITAVPSFLMTQAICWRESVTDIIAPEARFDVAVNL
jgi:hypothetical protein